MPGSCWTRRATLLACLVYCIRCEDTGPILNFVVDTAGSAVTLTGTSSKLSCSHDIETGIGTSVDSLARQLDGISGHVASLAQTATDQSRGGQVPTRALHFHNIHGDNSKYEYHGGSPSYAYSHGHNIYSMSKNGISVSMWLRFNALESNHRGPFFLTDQATNFFFLDVRTDCNCFQISTEELSRNMKASHDQCSIMGDGEFHHILITRGTDGYVSGFIDGTPIDMTFNNGYGGWGRGPRHFSLGGLMSSGGAMYSYANCEVADFRVFSRKIQAPLLAVQPYHPYLVMWLRMDDDLSSGKLVDASGHGNDLTLVGDGIVPRLRSGYAETPSLFNGTAFADAFTMTTYPLGARLLDSVGVDFGLTTGYDRWDHRADWTGSIAVWYKQTTAAGSGLDFLFARWACPYLGEWAVWAEDGGFNVAMDNTVRIKNAKSSGASIMDGNWHYVVAVSEASSTYGAPPVHKLYVDGQLGDSCMCQTDGGNAACNDCTLSGAYSATSHNSAVRLTAGRTIFVDGTAGCSMFNDAHVGWLNDAKMVGLQYISGVGLSAAQVQTNYQVMKPRVEALD